jgi:hypothetical protein
MALIQLGCPVLWRYRESMRSAVDYKSQAVYISGKPFETSTAGNAYPCFTGTINNSVYLYRATY